MASKRKRLTLSKSKLKAKRSAAAKKGWAKRKAAIKAAQREGSPIFEIVGPHNRPALTKDWDGMRDLERLTQTAREDFKGKRFQFAFKVQFENGDTKWISTMMQPNLKRQLSEGKAMIEVHLKHKYYESKISKVIESSIIIDDLEAMEEIDEDFNGDD